MKWDLYEKRLGWLEFALIPAMLDLDALVCYLPMYFLRKKKVQQNSNDWTLYRREIYCCLVSTKNLQNRSIFPAIFPVTCFISRYKTLVNINIYKYKYSSRFALFIFLFFLFYYIVLKPRPLLTYKSRVCFKRSQDEGHIQLFSVLPARLPTGGCGVHERGIDRRGILFPGRS